MVHSIACGSASALVMDQRRVASSCVASFHLKDHMDGASKAEAAWRHLRLADFIRQNEPSIVKEWTEFAHTRKPASDSMSRLALKNHIALILKFIADDLDTAQTPAEQFDKSRGYAPVVDQFHQSVPEVHAALRLADGFDIDQMISEYRALRASVIKQWTSYNDALKDTDIHDLIRFNEAVDQALTESAAYYTKTINDSRNLFLGILGHDLRNPIGAASMGARRTLPSRYR